jgi:hypothetical protein
MTKKIYGSYPHFQEHFNTLNKYHLGTTVVRGQDWQKNNSKNKNRNFEEIIVSKKSFFAW